MKFLKEKKGIIISFIIGVILASSIAVYATGYLASQVTYKDGKTVEYALNDLYANMQELSNNKKIEDLELVIDLSEIRSSNRRSTLTKNFNIEKDKIYYVDILYASAGGDNPEPTVYFYDSGKITFSENVVVLGQYANLLKVKANENGQATVNVSGDGNNTSYKDRLYFKIYN